MSILTLYWHLITLKTHFLFKNICSEFWCHFRVMRIIALMVIKLCLKNYEILFTLVTANPKKLFIYHNFFTKTDQKLFIHLNFCIVFREIKKKLFPEHLIFQIFDDIKEDHLSCCQISEREKQDTLVTKLVVKYKGSIMWEN